MHDFVSNLAAVCDQLHGRTDFHKLHSQGHDASAILYASDLLAGDLLPFIKHVQGDGPLIFGHACKLGPECLDVADFVAKVRLILAANRDSPAII
jgi:hypothetical protein